MRMRFAVVAAVLIVASDASAAVHWATWSGYPEATRTGTFSAGYTITMSQATFSGSSSVGAGQGFDCVPDAPGMGAPDNPPYQQILSGPPSTLLMEGDLVVEIDLNGLPRKSRVLFGIADQKFPLDLILLDEKEQPVDPDGITPLPFHNYYPPAPPTFPDTWVADQNSTLIGNRLSRDFLNDSVPSSFYNQTGLTILSGLPVETRRIRLLGTQFAEAEGLSLFVAIEATGDASGDGGTTAGDALLVLRVAVGSLELTDEILASCDMNGEGKITALDALLVLQASVGLLSATGSRASE